MVIEYNNTHDNTYLYIFQTYYAQGSLLGNLLGSLGTSVNSLANTVTNTVVTLGKPFTDNISLVKDLIAAGIRNSELATVATNAVSKVGSVATSSKGFTAQGATAIQDAVLGFSEKVKDLEINVQNATNNLNLPTVDVLSQIQNILNKVGVGELSSVSVPLTSDLSAALNDIKSVLNNAAGVLNNIISKITNAENGIVATVANGFNSIFGLLKGFDDCVKPKTQGLLASATTNAKSCLLNEVATLTNLWMQLQSLDAQIENDLAQGILSNVTMTSTESFATIATTIIANVQSRITTCETAATVKSVDNLTPAAESIIACIN